MGRAISPESQLLLSKLTTEWQSLDPIVSAVAATIPPGKALRRYESMYARRAMERKDTQAQSSLSQDEQIASGANSLVRHRLHGLKRMHIDLRMVDGVDQIRLKQSPSSLPLGTSYVLVPPVAQENTIDLQVRVSFLEDQVKDLLVRVSALEDQVKELMTEVAYLALAERRRSL